MNADLDLEFGKAAVQRGLLTIQQLGDCLGRLAREDAAGSAASLAQLVVREGLVKPEAAELLLAALSSADGLTPIGSAAETPPTSTLTAPSPDARTPQTPTPTPPPGSRAGAASDREKGSSTFERKYAVAGELARGGMGIVLTGKDLAIRREVAIKVLKAGAKAAPEQVAKFVEEAQIQGQLEHPNICPVHELGVDARGRPYFAMKKVKGRSLAEVLTSLRDANPDEIPNPKSQASGAPADGGAALRGRPDTEMSSKSDLPREWKEPIYTLPKLLEVFLKVCDAVAFAHSKGVIHRDLKPENIMVGEFGEVLVMDWGLAKIAGLPDRHEKELVATDRAEGGGLVSLEGTVIGTPAYMPPEQAAGAVERIDERSDIYALGGILYAILTLRAPYEGNDVREVLEKVKRHDLVTPSERARKGTGVGASIARDTRGSRPMVAPTPAATPLAPHGQSTIPNPPRPPNLEATPEGRASVPARIRVVPPDLEAACLKAMSARKEDRYATVQALKADITAFLEGRTLAAARYTFTQLAKLWVKRNKVFAATAGAALVVLAAGAGFYMVDVTRARTAAERAAAGERTAATQARTEADRARAAEGQAKSQEAEANRQRTEAERNAEEARRAKAETDLRLAESLVAQGDALTLAGRYAEARSRLDEARRLFEQVGKSSWTADLGLWELSRRAPPALNTFAGHVEVVWSVAFSPDGRLALSGSNDNTLKLWEVETGREVRTFSGHGDIVLSVAFSPDGRLALSGSNDNTLKLWEVDTGREVRTFSGHGEGILSVAFSPDGRLALSGSDDNTLKLWEVETGREVRTFSGHKYHVTGVAFSPDGRFALSGSGDWTLRLWDVETGREVRTFFGHKSHVQSVAFSPDGRLALSGSNDNTLKLWEVETGREVRTFSGHKSHVQSVAFSPDGRFALSGSWDNTLKLWEVDTGREERTFSGHGNYVTSIAFSPDGRLALSGSDGNTLKLWEVETGREVRTFSGHGDVVRSVAFSPDGRFALSGSDDNTLKLWEVETGREVRTFSGHGTSVVSVAFSSDGRLALSGSSANTLKLWEVDTGREVGTGREVKTLFGHADVVRSVAFSPDGRLALSGSDDNTLKLWEVETGREVRTFSGHGDSVSSVAFSPDGRLALSGNGDKTLKLWDFSRPERYRAFEKRLAEARDRLRADPKDAAALAAYGEWYAFRGVWDWAAEFLEKARKGGAKVSALELGRCYWQKAGQSGRPQGPPLQPVVGGAGLVPARTGGSGVPAATSGGRGPEAPPTPGGPNPADLAAARREFERALADKEAPEFYLKLCLQAIERDLQAIEREEMIERLRSAAALEAVFGQTFDEKGITLLNYEDGKFSPAVQGEKPCVKTTTEGAQKHLYFDVLDIWRPAGAVKVTVEYFDGPSGSFRVDYDSLDEESGARDHNDPALGGRFKTTRPVSLGGSLQWKTAAFDLPDPRFEGRQNGGADFRIATDADLYVRRVAVRRIAKEAEPK